MNDKGFLVASSTLIALIVTGLFLTSFQPLILGKAQINKEVSEFTQTKVNTRNGLERLHALYGEDIANDGSEVTYEDLNLNYIIKELSKEISIINAEISDGETFLINNPTHLKIDIDFTDNSYRNEDAYYSFDISKDGVSILSEPIINRQGGIIININKEKIGKNYGDYEVSYSTVNSSIDVTIEYSEQSYRELEIIENDKIKRLIVIENDVIQEEVNQQLKIKTSK